jgi:pimeloyl-ACP methyl ester carboxylesterase
MTKEIPMNDATTTIQHVTSKDGTTIAYDRLGDGPPIVLLPGGSVDRQANAGLAQLLAADFTVLNVDRRGRGDSGDTLPYAIEREFEDVDAVVEAVGGSAALYGSSSGAALAMLATAAGESVSKLVMWEAPYFRDPAARPPADTVEQYERRVAEGRRGDAVEYFMGTVVGLPPQFVAFARTQPWWAGQEKIAHTLAYDGRIMGDYSLPLDVAARVACPALVLAGGASVPAFRETAELLAAAMPRGRAAVLEGQEHNVDPSVLAVAMREFLLAG